MFMEIRILYNFEIEIDTATTDFDKAEIHIIQMRKDFISGLICTR